ncbi:unnamed protein product, partial [Ilex paraguariensis]
SRLYPDEEKASSDVEDMEKIQLFFEKMVPLDEEDQDVGIFAGRPKLVGTCGIFDGRIGKGDSELRTRVACLIDDRR